MTGVCSHCLGTGRIVTSFVLRRLIGIDRTEYGMCGKRSKSQYYRCTRSQGHTAGCSVTDPVAGDLMTWAA